MYSKNIYEGNNASDAYEKAQKILNNYKENTHVSRVSWKKAVQLYKESKSSKPEADREKILDKAFWVSTGSGLPVGFGRQVLINYIAIGMKTYLERRKIKTSDGEIRRIINDHIIENGNGRGMLLAH